MKQTLNRLAAGQTLSEAQAVHAFDQIMTGHATPAQVGAMLALIQQRGPTADELLGGASVMRQHATPVTVPQGLRVIDTCGTGGDHAQTFNISTAGAIIAAAAGRPHNVAVAKHGNRSVTSKSGSSQVLEALGVKLNVSGPTLTRCLDDAGLCFCFAPAHHPAMKHVAPVRQELGFRTIFNLLGPLTNPAGAKRQVIGVFEPGLTELFAQVLNRLGSEHVMVVHGQMLADDGGHETVGLDELSTGGPSRVSHLQGGQVRTYQIDPASVKLPTATLASLRVDSVAASAGVIREVFAGKPGPARDIVCLNAAAALVVADLAVDLQTGVELAAQAIDSRAAAGVLDRLAQITQSDETP